MRLSLSIYITKEANQASKDFSATCSVHKCFFRCWCGGRKCTVHRRVQSTVYSTVAYVVHIYTLRSNCVNGELKAQQKRENHAHNTLMLLLLRIVCLTVWACMHVYFYLLVHSSFNSVHSFIATDFIWARLHYILYNTMRVRVRAFFNAFIPS